jgi:hypothetical protein
MLDDKVKSCIRMLIYPIQFEKEPVDGMERVFRTVLAPDSVKIPISDYVDSIKIALESSEELSTLIARNHSEAAIRRYLVKLLQRLEQTSPK